MRLELLRRTDLALRAMRLLAASSERMKSAQLAKSLMTSTHYLQQVMAPLVRRGWVTSDPGPRGGYAAAVSLGTISLLELIEATDGSPDTNRCVLRDAPCPQEHQCALHEPWSEAKSVLLAALGEIPIMKERP